MGVEIHRIDQFRPTADDAGEDRRLVIGLGRDARIGSHPDEDDALALAHRIGSHPDAVGLIGLVLDQGGDGGADPVGAETPAVVAALDRLTLARVLDQLAGRQRRGPVRADVAQGIDLTGAGAADQHRLSEQHVTRQRGRGHVARQGDKIPGVADKAAAEGGRRGLGGVAGLDQIGG